MRLLFSFCLAFSVGFCFAQPSQEEQQAIVAEGFMLYKLELAAWNASDLLAPVRDVGKLDSVKGYVSYQQGNSYNTIFYGGENNARVYVNFVFDNECSIKSAIMDLIPRNATSKERQLIAMRIDALDRINKNDKKFFEFFEGTSFNLIPVINADGRRVIVLTGPQENGDVMFGNDYILEYTADNKFKAQSRLHPDLITVPMEAKVDGKVVAATEHTHLDQNSKYITATDICTILLYAEYTNWKQHYVLSEKWMSIWDVEKKQLTIIPRRDSYSIYDVQENKKSKE